ncbi:heterokaryon incompatibility protein-domain-containing protein [Podospora aff. communis PSN243]|uniref:Heterokaryon incompatibility protein-domain-containing protein n=1 Tax=Podospora aff. communis PSN243 TaxID=3040156 RepID=A0AAV9G3V5_9PEZI|nr:heterokaryon incompatibility protein-domain-containing protein [Podospora aff. communis PSN243]
MDLDRSLNREHGFKYPPIDPKRQLRLLRPSKTSSGDLDFVFEVVALDRLQDTRYKALSYTWGRVATPADLHTIRVNNQPFLVRKNLSDFLSSNPFDSNLIPADNTSPCLLFIDALCINQFDTYERQSQVHLMTQIYRRADSVIAWLGLPPPSLLPAIQSLASLPATVPPTLWTPPQLSAHRYLSHHPYWTRLWVLQELLLAPNATVRCGAYSFPLRLFSSSHPHHAKSPAERLTTHRLRTLLRPRPGHDPLQMGTSVLPMKQMLDSLSNTPYYRLSEYQSPVPDTLKEVFTRYGHLECSDKRDKLYGFLGLLSEKSRRQICVDYERGVEFAFYQTLRVGLGEVAGEVEAELVKGEYHAVLDRGWVERYYGLVRGVFGVEEKEGRRVLGRVVEELRLEEWLGEVAVAVGMGWRVGGVVRLDEVQRWERVRRVEDGGKGWLERMHGRQEVVARKMGERFGRGRVMLRA